MDLMNLNKILDKLLAVVVIGAPFAFLCGLVWYVLPKDQAPVEIVENAETIDEIETMDSIMSYTGVIDDELSPREKTGTRVGSLTRGSGVISHVDSIGHGINHKYSLVRFRSALTATNRPKFTLPSTKDYGKILQREWKTERVTHDSTDQSTNLPVETKEITPVDTL